MSAPAVIVAAPGERSSLDPALVGAWYAMYEVLAHRATHEVNNALNAVAMNLEVARLRAVAGADAERVAPFAAAAAESHDEVVAMVQPLMALARGPLDEPCDVSQVVAQIVAVLAPALRAKGGSLVLDGAGQGVRTAAPSVAVRLAVADLLAGATGTPAAAWRCAVTNDSVPTVTLTSAAPTPAGTPHADRAFGALLDRVGVRRSSSPEGVAWALTFPSV